MSYILDALKRAESDRSRGAVPNVHTQLGVGNETASRAAVASRLGWGLIVVTALVSAAGAWWWFSADQPVALNPADAPGEVRSPALSMAPVVSPTEPVAPMAPKPAAPLAVVPTALPARKPTAATPAPSIAPAVAGDGSSPAARPMARAPSAVAPSPAAEERVYALKELPDDIRNSLPTLAIGGATYSENPANRMLIVNGGIFHEGDKLAPELTLQQIKLRAAVLNFRGYRYAISY